MKHRCLSLFLLAAPLVFSGPSQAASWSFAVFCDSRGEVTGKAGSDTGVRAAVLGPIARAVAAEGVDLVLFPGDEVDGSAAKGSLEAQLMRWKEIMAPIYSAKIPVYNLRGNHENQQEGPIAVWHRIFPGLPENGPKSEKGLTYKVVHKNATFIGFDQYVGRSKTYDASRYDGVINSGVVNPWVITEISETTTRWLFVFGHEPAFIGHHLDCLANAPSERDALWDALGAKGGTYFCGHDHLYLRRTLPDRYNRSVLECIVGCAGAPPYALDHEAMNADIDRGAIPTDLYINAAQALDGKKNTDGEKQYFGYLLVTIDGDQATGEWKALKNFDVERWATLGAPRFETLDSFVLSAGS